MQIKRFCLGNRWADAGGRVDDPGKRQGACGLGGSGGVLEGERRWGRGGIDRKGRRGCRE